MTTSVAPKPSATPPAKQDTAAQTAATATTPAAKNATPASPGEQAAAPIVNAPSATPAGTLPAIVQPAKVVAAKEYASKATTTAEHNQEAAVLKADTLARLRTLPDVTPEQLAEFERSLAPTSGEVSTMYLQQLNALVKLRQKEANVATTAPTSPRVSTAPPELPEFADDQRPAALKNKTVASAPVEPQEPAEVAPVSYQEEVKENLPPIITPKTWAERLRQSQESGQQTSAKSGIFSGRVQTSISAPAEGEPATHTTNKPASDVPPTLSPSDVPATRETASSATPETTPTSWQKHLTDTIAALETQLRAEDLPTADRLRYEAGVRMLYVLADRRDDALREISGLDAAQQDYWRSQLHSLHVSLAAEGTPVAGRRATLALRPLREAVEQLGSLATLDVRNIAFCSEVTMWGQYKEFPKYEFKPDQEVLLYFEVENFTALETEKGFATEFVSSYEVFDSAGRRVAEQQFPSASETCRNRRRDYFIRYHMHIPKQLAAGEYTLQLTVEDQKGHKFGQGSMKFKVL